MTLDMYVYVSTHKLDGGVQNSLMASAPGHDFWDMLIDLASTERKPSLRQSYYLENPDIHWSTGTTVYMKNEISQLIWMIGLDILFNSPAIKLTKAK